MHEIDLVLQSILQNAHTRNHGLYVGLIAAVILYSLKKRPSVAIAGTSATLGIAAPVRQA